MKLIQTLLQGLYRVLIGLTEIWTLARVIIICALASAMIFDFDLRAMLNPFIAKFFMLNFNYKE